ncbi:hypothetical protein RB594_006440 [Gaeumannomyces avenae]
MPNTIAMEYGNDPLGTNVRRILSWLEACAAHSPPLAAPAHANIPPTPPMSSSPSKRKRPLGSGGRGRGPHRDANTHHDGDEAPGDGAPGDGAPGDGAPGDGAPGDGAPGDGAPGDEAPGEAIPNQNPESTVPGQGQTSLDGDGAFGVQPPFAFNLPWRPSASASYPSNSGFDSRVQTSQTSRPSRRSASPVKRPFHLTLLAKPVEFTDFSNPLSQLPPDVRDLYTKLRRLTRYTEPFIPEASREFLANMEDQDDWADAWFRPTQDEFQPWASSQIDEPLSSLACRQADALAAIRKSALRCKKEDALECQWNQKVHSPILELAAASTKCGVVCESIINVSIATPWLPAMGNQSEGATVTEVARGKMVDFALALDLGVPLPSHAILRQALAALLASGTGDAAQMVNQSTCDYLSFKPIAVSIETKAGAGASRDGTIQLGVWVAAWHRRIAALGLVPHGGIITQPLLLCVQDSWKLYFACDRGTRIEIVGPMELGSMTDLLSVYCVYEALRELCKWIGGTFCEWWKGVLGVA